jgi:predicted 3-demethylubiquinone-9 3-methyltransferase (glyoxalase superfamily)
MPASAKPQDRIRPFIWFDHQAEEAVDLYVSIFGDARIISKMPGPGGKASGVEFQLEGRQFIAFNGGPHLKLNEAVSLFVSCDSQAEVDRYWDLLTADGGQPSQCGWLKDRFGVSWQIIPKALMRLLGDEDPARAGRAMQAMLKMNKIIIADLEKAAAG